MQTYDPMPVEPVAEPLKKLLVAIPFVFALAACGSEAADQKQGPVKTEEAPVRYEHFRADGLPVSPELNEYFNFVIQDTDLDRPLTMEEMFTSTMLGSLACDPEALKATGDPNIAKLRTVLTDAQCAALTATNPLGFPTGDPQGSSETASEPAEEPKEEIGPGYLDPDAYDGGRSSGESQLEWLCSQGIADPSEC